MKKNYVIYLIIPLLLLITGITLISCGGGEDGYVNPGLQGEPSDQLISKEVSGYIYHTGSLSSSETGEVTEKFIILSSPATGDDSFLSQLWGYFEETSPDSLNTQEMQNLHSRLSVEMENYVPLPEWNPSAQLYSIYQDSKSSSPISVDGRGYFSSTVLVSSKDDNVSFEVILGEDACYPVEAIASSDVASSSEGGIELKSCPEIILTFPGWCEIFAVYGNPSVNLKDAGLTFTLNDPSMGWVTEPFYVKCNGVRNYNVAYGIYISAGNLETPVSTTITAQTATGLTLNIFTEVVKSCGSIAGHVGGAGVVPFCGFVYSPGFDAFDCIDEAGNYELDKVFKGHFRKVVAVYWVQVNGQLVKHREERTIDFFNGNLTGFDLPETVQPTPTCRPPYDAFYDLRVCEVYYQYLQWEKELGSEAATQKTVDWLNKNLVEAPPIPPEVVKASVDDYDNTAMWIQFSDGHGIRIAGEYDSVNWGKNSDVILENENVYNKINTTSIEISGAPSQTVNSRNILILAPYMWEEEDLDLAGVYTHRVYGKIGDYLKGLTDEEGNPVYNVHRVVTKSTDFTYGPISYDPTIPDYLVDDPNDPKYKLVQQTIVNKPSAEQERNYILPDEDFRNLDNYGVIYIATHSGGGVSLSCGHFFENVDELDTFTKYNKEFIPFDPNTKDGVWHMEYRRLNKDPNEPPDPTAPIVKFYSVNYMFFKSEAPLTDSIVYLDGCDTRYFWYDSRYPFCTAKVIFGHDIKNYVEWSRMIAFKMFCLMMFGTEAFPIDPNSSSLPPRKSVADAYNVLSFDPDPDRRFNPDPTDYPGNPPYEGCTLFMDSSVNFDNLYFPAVVDITVHQE